ncbi:uncharacterized protein A4U43_C01F29490 [Asparagus officinalis]|uniref:LOB domain-containing protein n=1 Tax=Asparagus officinalis TaxID=4686 RepID=A0A5P1FTQ5_ASPOF|nr:LOB domain-containing protein 12-like [Asparagus officinalis]ONK81472.1 uncharacterized protein A4U43_C01F29490 [Asparagus officinalis]
MDPRAQPQVKREVPCAGCRMLHRKCSYDCMLAPYFPANETEKFAVVHKVFGASNVIKMLQMVDDVWKEDAVKSMVYEAYARIRNPVYGCTFAISYLQKCVEELEEQLKTTQQQILKSQEEIGQLSFALDSVYLPVNNMFDERISSDNTTIHDTAFTIPMDYY